MATLLSSDELPPGLSYPPEFIHLVRCNLLHLEPWHVLSGERLVDRFVGLADRYPGRSLVPFAERQDNDDVACWDSPDAKAILIVHDFASIGSEVQEGFPDFVTWLRSVFDEFLDWMP